MRFQRCHPLVSVLVGFMVVSASIFAVTVSRAQTGDRCFAETGQCISGLIRSYWETNGGLPVFGYPISAQRMENVEGRELPVQWFERDRLEIQSNGQVTAGRLGAQYLALTGRPWETFQQVSSAPSQCVFFPETRHSLCPENFLGYWRSNGGLERFGYPITEPLQETIEGRDLLVQYFERRRLELHTELSGNPVLLGLLGRDVAALLTNPAPSPTPTAGTGGAPQCVTDVLQGGTESERLLLRAYESVTFRNDMGCPTFGLEQNITASSQRLEQGEMLWIRLPELSRARSEFRFIFAIINPGPEFRRYNDTWQEGVDPDRPDFTPPREGLYTPWRGFGKVWANDTVLRDRIGWALEPEAQSHTASVILLNKPGEGPDQAAFLILLEDTRVVYAFGNPANPRQVQIIAP